MFAHLRLHGEWFQAKDDLLSFLQLNSESTWTATERPRRYFGQN